MSLRKKCIGCKQWQTIPAVASLLTGKYYWDKTDDSVICDNCKSVLDEFNLGDGDSRKLRHNINRLNITNPGAIEQSYIRHIKRKRL